MKGAPAATSKMASMLDEIEQPQPPEPRVRSLLHRPRQQPPLHHQSQPSRNRHPQSTPRPQYWKVCRHGSCCVLRSRLSRWPPLQHQKEFHHSSKSYTFRTISRPRNVFSLHQHCSGTCHDCYPVIPSAWQSQKVRMKMITESVHISRLRLLSQVRNKRTS